MNSRGTLVNKCYDKYMQFITSNSQLNIYSYQSKYYILIHLAVPRIYAHSCTVNIVRICYSFSCFICLPSSYKNVCLEQSLVYSVTEAPREVYIWSSNKNDPDCSSNNPVSRPHRGPPARTQPPSLTVATTKVFQSEA